VRASANPPSHSRLSLTLSIQIFCTMTACPSCPICQLQINIYTLRSTWSWLTDAQSLWHKQAARVKLISRFVNVLATLVDSRRLRRHSRSYQPSSSCRASSLAYLYTSSCRAGLLSRTKRVKFVVPKSRAYLLTIIGAIAPVSS